MEIVQIQHNNRLGPNAPFPRPAIGTTSSCGVSQSLNTTLVTSKAIALVHKTTGEKKLWAGQPIITTDYSTCSTTSIEPTTKQPSELR